MNRCSRKKSGKNWSGSGRKSMNPPMSKKAPLEDEFREWLLRRKLLSQSTVQNYLVRLRRLIADYGLQGTLFTVILDKRSRLTQRYYKEFLCEHFSHIIIPLMQSEEWGEGENSDD